MKLYLPILLVCFASLSHARSVPRAPQESTLHRREEPVQEEVVNDDDALYKLLASELGADGENAAGLSAYTITKSPTESYDWIVGSIEDCQREMGPATPIGSTLDCDAESPTPCTRSVTYQDSQTSSSTTGFHWEFGVEGGGAIGPVNVKSTFKYGQSSSTTQSITKGEGNTYTFPVPAGKHCTPTIVSYRMSCKGTAYNVNHDAWNTKANPGGCASLNIDFASNKIFEGFDPRYYYYVSGTDLYEMVSTTDFPPSGCDTVKGGDVWVRNMVLSNQDPASKQPLFYTTGKSLSTISCVLSQ
ncbi:MAG: hypothetical protein J3R72DRAFT_463895 [Linnemannia gamsii]|nr:MAG: hypothetical protein J3R72DRAFT_463895 [Linnemannia gamsii]